MDRALLSFDFALFYNESGLYFSNISAACVISNLLRNVQVCVISQTVERISLFEVSIFLVTKATQRRAQKMNTCLHVKPQVLIPLTSTTHISAIAHFQTSLRWRKKIFISLSSEDAATEMPYHIFQYANQRSTSASSSFVSPESARVDDASKLCVISKTG